MIKRAAPAAFCDLYLRISEADDEDALDRHEADARELAAKLGVPVRRVLREIVSATKTAVVRKRFEELLKDPAPVIICWHQDRLIRTIRDLERLIETGSAIHSVQASPLDLATPTGRAVARTVTAWSQFEGEHRRARQESSMAQARAAGKWTGGRRTMGYEVGMVAFREPEAQALRDAFVWLVQDGVQPAEIARRWNERGLRTTQAGKEWHGGWVAEIMRTPSLAGLRTHLGVVVGTADWEPLIDRLLWERAQAILQDPARKRVRRDQSLLSSIAICGICEGTIHAGGNADRGGLYNCTTSYCLSLRRPRVDEYVLGRMVSLLQTDIIATGWLAELEGKPLNGSTSDPKLVAELQGLETRLDALSADLTMSERVLAQRSAAIEKRMQELQEEIAASTVGSYRPALADLYDGEPEDFPQAPTSVQRAVIGATVVIKLFPPGRGRRDWSAAEVVVIEGPDYDPETD